MLDAGSAGLSPLAATVRTNRHMLMTASERRGLALPAWS
jgi:hypothetical protein